MPAGLTDWRWRRIPNWLTVPALLAGIAANAALNGMSGLKTSLLGAGFGTIAAVAICFLRSLGAGDWKLAGALGAIVGPERCGFADGFGFRGWRYGAWLVIYKRGSGKLYVISGGCWVDVNVSHARGRSFTG